MERGVPEELREIIVRCGGEASDDATVPELPEAGRGTPRASIIMAKGPLL